MRHWLLVSLLAVAAIFALFISRSPGGSQADQAVIDAVKAQAPLVMPAQTSEGWPQQAITLAIDWYEVGDVQRALYMAGELWRLRDPVSGLWVNSFGYVDTVNGFFATILYKKLGQEDRAREVSQALIAKARSVVGTGVAYNTLWFPTLSATILGDPMPRDLMSAATPGLNGIYAPGETVTAKGKYYADLMRAWWDEVGGERRPLLSNETEYCPSLGAGQGECEAAYRWARGESYVPSLGGPYSFYNDGVIFYSVVRLP